MKTPDQRLEQALESLRAEKTSISLEDIQARQSSAGTSRDSQDTSIPFFSQFSLGTKIMTLTALGLSTALIGYLSLSPTPALNPSPSPAPQSTAQTQTLQSSSLNNHDDSPQASSAASQLSTKDATKTLQTEQTQSNEPSTTSNDNVGHRLPIELKGQYLSLKANALAQLGIATHGGEVSFYDHLSATKVRESFYSITTGLGFTLHVDTVADHFPTSTVRPTIVTDLNGILRAYSDPDKKMSSGLNPVLQAMIDELGREADVSGKQLLIAYPRLEDPKLPMEKRITVTRDENMIIARVMLSSEENEAMAKKDHDKVTENFRNDNLIGVRIVLVHHENNDSGFIFWYSPSKEFLAALPDYYRTKLEVELGLRKESDQFTAGCTYTVSCLSSNGAITNTGIQPNPTKSNARILLNLSAERQIKAELYNMNGQFVRTLVAERTLAAGQSDLHVDLRGVEPGIYLLVMQTDKGEKVVQRLIRTNDN